MDNNLKTKLRENLFFLKNAERSVADEFLDSLRPAHSFTKGETVCCPDDEPKGLGILIKGSLDILTGTENANMRRMEAPDVFGAASLFGGTGYVSTMRAAGNAEIIFVGQDELNALLQKSFTVTQNYISFLSEKIRFLNMRIDNFTAPTAATALWDHLAKGADADGKVPVPKNMSRLAKMLNMGRTSLYRAVDELERSGKLIRREEEWIIK